ncbi:hypothetical protein IQ255_30430 [Pleurocapsales cyanobacterium LEGE 10410]|nr:hypothetical protein [Pleurocapsales cyanobacterium LEGE 10410]
MTKIQIIFCPNCGDRATKTIVDNSIQRTACPGCDYLLVQCVKTGKVIEAYAPGINSYCAIPSTSAQAFDALNCPQAASASKPLE